VFNVSHREKILYKAPFSGEVRTSRKKGTSRWNKIYQTCPHRVFSPRRGTLPEAPGGQRGISRIKSNEVGLFDTMVGKNRSVSFHRKGRTVGEREGAKALNVGDRRKETSPHVYRKSILKFLSESLRFSTDHLQKASSPLLGEGLVDLSQQILKSS